MAGKTYHIRWKGISVLELTPPAVPHPLFQRRELQQDSAPMKLAIGDYRLARIHS